MKRNIDDYYEFKNAIENDELVFIFGTGISSALTGKPYSWWKWIVDGIDGLHDANQSKDLRYELDYDDSTSNMINVVGKVIMEAKADASYDMWMHNAFEINRIKDSKLPETLKKLLLTQTVFATTNYDSLLERATGLGALSYEDPDIAFSMLDKHLSTHVLHIHGIYDSVKGIDNIIADEEQYCSVMENQGAQFIQNILGTRTLVFVGCGKTTEDANISRFIEFARTHLKMDRTYYFLCKETVDGLPDHIAQIEYGDDYADLPIFLEDIAQARLIRKISENKIVGLTPYEKQVASGDSLLKYHFSQRTIAFCGRDVELSKLQDFVETDGDFSWWSVTGQAGSGKSRLVMEFLYRLPSSWFGFFLNDDCRQSDFESFSPFCNTVVVIDYVAGRERFAADVMAELQRKFTITAYKLRILLIERENSQSSGSWYSKLIQRANRSEKIMSAQYSDTFLNLVDMDREDVESFIASVCIAKGKGDDQASELYDAYGRKFEHLRYRPLYLQMFVEAWIDNNCEIPQYNSYTQLLEDILHREQERWIAAVDGDHKVCNAFIRLMVRANISGRLEIEKIPDLYKADWDIIRNYINGSSFVGRQRQELQDTLINSFCQNIDEEHAIIAPQFPDIIKEFMFSYYIDDDFLPEMMKEIWQHSASAFHIFIMRCMMDFPGHKFFTDAINGYKASTKDYEVLVGRLRMLDGRFIQKGEDPKVFWDIIDNEYQFWKSVEIPEEKSEETDLLAGTKLTGLYKVAQNIGGWSLYDLSEMEEVIDEMLAVKGGSATEELKKHFLQEHITALSTKGFFDEAESVRGKLEGVISESSDEYDSLLRMHIGNDEMMDHILSGEIEAGKKTLLEMERKCDYQNLQCVQLLAHSSFNYDYNSMLFGDTELIGNHIAVKCEKLYPDDWIIRSRRIGCEISLIQKQYFEDIISRDALREKVLELEEDLSTMEFNGSESDEALDSTWGAVMTLKLNVASKEEVKKIITEAEGIIKRYPHLSSVATTNIQAVTALHRSHMKDKVSHEEVEKLYKYVEQNLDSKSVRTTFFEMLRNSVDEKNIQDYLNQDVLREAISDARYSPYVGSGIRELDEWLGIYDFVEQPYVRKCPKIGRNDPCPCGSGKKFKKCCMGKGVYD